MNVRSSRPVLIVAVAVLGWLGYGVYRRATEWDATRPLPAPGAPATSGEARGRAVYGKYGCALCHGRNGEQGIANPNSQTKVIPALTYTKEGYSRKELRMRILHGARSIPSADPKQAPPPYRMPGWQGLMTDQELNDLSDYLFSLMPKNTKEDG